MKTISKWLQDSLSQLLICFSIYYLKKPIYFLKLLFLLVSFNLLKKTMNVIIK